MPPSWAIAVAFVLASGAMGALWLVQCRTRNAGVVDVAWGAIIGLQGVLFAVTADGPPWRRLLLAMLIAGWSLRITVHLFRRVVGHPEEGRYATLREKHGPRFNAWLFGFFQLQAVSTLLFSLPVLVAARKTAAEFTLWDGLAIAIWLVGSAGVATADAQLAAWKRRPDTRGRTCREGLWRYSRHPNYFFEWVHWWAYPVAAVGAAWWWLTPLTPLALLYFLFYMTGIPPTEAQALASRGDDYRRYQRTTSSFVPWFPRQEST